MSKHKIGRARPLTFAVTAAATLAFGVGTAGAAVGTPTLAAPFGTASVANNTLTINGTNGADAVAIRNPVGDPTKIQVDFGNDGTAEGTFDRATFTAINVFLRNSDDQFIETSAVVSDEALAVDGGNGNDNIQTGNGNDLVLGGTGNDVINTGAGNDVVFSGGGNDTVTGASGADTEVLGSGQDNSIWNPGDGSDIVEGQAGFDTLTFHGANVPENMVLSANGTRSVFTRDVGNIRMDVNDVEHLAVDPIGGADTVTVNDMSGTGFRQADVDLAATGGLGDGQTDLVTVNGTTHDDTVRVSTTGGSVDVKGLQTQTHVTGMEPTDKLQVNGAGGDDAVSIGHGVSSVIDVGVEIGSQL